MTNSCHPLLVISYHLRLQLLLTMDTVASSAYGPSRPWLAVSEGRVKVAGQPLQASRRPRLSSGSAQPSMGSAQPRLHCRLQPWPQPQPLSLSASQPLSLSASLSSALSVLCPLCPLCPLSNPLPLPSAHAHATVHSPLQPLSLTAPRAASPHTLTQLLTPELLLHQCHHPIHTRLVHPHPSPSPAAMECDLLSELREWLFPTQLIFPSAAASAADSYLANVDLIKSRGAYDRAFISLQRIADPSYYRNYEEQITADRQDMKHLQVTSTPSPSCPSSPSSESSPSSPPPHPPHPRRPPHPPTIPAPPLSSSPLTSPPSPSTSNGSSASSPGPPSSDLSPPPPSSSSTPPHLPSLHSPSAPLPCSPLPLQELRATARAEKKVSRARLYDCSTPVNESSAASRCRLHDAAAARTRSVGRAVACA